MNKENQYKKTIEQIRHSGRVTKLSPLEKEELRRAVLEQIAPEREPRKRLDLLFSWVEQRWLRWALSLASLSLLLLFLVQQVGISQRMHSLEEHMLGLELEQAMEDWQPGTGQKVLLKHIDKGMGDSILVSRRDLEILLENYQELMKEKSENNINL